MIWDHPRPCGKDLPTEPAPDDEGGSPPPVRERQPSEKHTGATIRITPARAGKTHRYDCQSQPCQDHPRPCGKDAAEAVICAALSGSPPPVRERLQSFCGSFVNLGITPARAGKTCQRLRTRTVPRDHPRPCGKDSRTEEHCRNERGSPPPVRERPCSHRFPPHRPRITPARAGKTLSIHIDEDIRQDHPRPCGKDFAIAL